MDERFFLALSSVLPVVLYPLSVVCACLVLAILAPLRAGSRRVLTAAALCLLLVASCGPIARDLGRSLEWQHPAPAEPPAADAIVLLGGFTLPIRPPRLRIELDQDANRLLGALALYRSGKAPLLYVAGGRLDLFETLGPEAPDIAALLRELGVPETAMLLETSSRNTYENAVEAKRILGSRGVRRILLVTSALHMPRAVGLFRHQGFDVVPYPTDFHVVEIPEASGGSAWSVIDLVPRASSLAYTTRVLREWIGIAVYRFRGLMD
ncbi:MAG: YdcF family protein [Deltaproteobacteria bacterium]|nr:YdcF family protein [Deltaproteobacteria bacterium]